MPLSGTSGYVNVNGVAKTADKWSGDLDQAAVDRANFTTAGEPSNAAGQRTGDITVEGPYEAALGILRGTVYTFRLGVTSLLYMDVPARVTRVSVNNDCKDAPRWRVTAKQYGAATLAI